MPTGVVAHCRYKGIAALLPGIADQVDDGRLPVRVLLEDCRLICFGVWQGLPPVILDKLLGDCVGGQFQGRAASRVQVASGHSPNGFLNAIRPGGSIAGNIGSGEAEVRHSEHAAM